MKSAVFNLWDTQKGLSAAIAGNTPWQPPCTFDRLEPIPLDKSSIFFSYQDAEDYISSKANSYPGQFVGVVDSTTSSVTPYIVNAKPDLSGRYLVKLGTDSSVEQALEAGVVTVQSISNSDYAASYAVYQNNKQVGATINIPKDKVVENASVVEILKATNGSLYNSDDINADGTAKDGATAITAVSSPGHYLKLQIANVTDPKYVEVPGIVDTHSGAYTTTISTYIETEDGERKIKAIVRPQSIGADHLTTSLSNYIKGIADNVGSQSVSTQINSAINGLTGNITKNTGNIVTAISESNGIVTATIGQAEISDINNLQSTLSAKVISVVSGTTNGTIKYTTQNGTSEDVSVTGLQSAAFTTTDAISSAAVNNVRGTTSDTASNATVYGVSAYVTNTIGNDSNTSADMTLKGVKKYAETAYLSAVGPSGDLSTNNTINGAKTYATGVGLSVYNRLVGDTNAASSDNSVNGAKKYTDQKISDVIGTSSQSSALTSPNPTIYSVRNYATGISADLAGQIASARGVADNAISGVENTTGTGVVTGISVNTSTHKLTATYADQSSSYTASGAHTVLTSITQSATGKITNYGTANFLSSVTVTAVAGTSGILSSYQIAIDGITATTKIDIPKDKVVQGGELVNVLSGGTEASRTYTVNGTAATSIQAEALKNVYSKDGPYIKITLANDTNTEIFIAVPDLVDTYTADNTASDGTNNLTGTVDTYMGSDRKIHAELVKNSLTEDAFSTTSLFHIYGGSADANS